tara:strand:+ start:168 stop:422 length:255 start_codon:yes stop_codon:yes gene_type:complete
VAIASVHGVRHVRDEVLVLVVYILQLYLSGVDVSHVTDSGLVRIRFDGIAVNLGGGNIYRGSDFIRFVLDYVQHHHKRKQGQQR